MTTVNGNRRWCWLISTLGIECITMSLAVNCVLDVTVERHLICNRTQTQHKLDKDVVQRSIQFYSQISFITRGLHMSTRTRHRAAQMTLCAISFIGAIHNLKNPISLVVRFPCDAIAISTEMELSTKKKKWKSINTSHRQHGRTMQVIIIVRILFNSRLESDCIAHGRNGLSGWKSNAYIHACTPATRCLINQNRDERAKKKKK